MIGHAVRDWDDAYANAQHIAGSERWPEAWRMAAEAFRAKLAGAGRTELDISYGEKPRNRMDIFRPAGEAKGLVVFIHGGYWLRFDKSSWSHLAEGAVERGFAVAMPSYTLCPEIRIGGIVREIGLAVTEAAARVAGPLHLTGHSAGGHLAARLAAGESPLPPPLRTRLGNIVPISGLPDLRPLMNTAMNRELGIDEEEARRESPALLRPLPGTRLTCWVGGAERAEFRRQNALLANVWTGLGARTSCVEEPDRHHFDVIDGLRDPGSGLVRALLDGV